ncbi:MAG: hypothetical protein RR923_03030 [Bacilli bacterium]
MEKKTEQIFFINNPYYKKLPVDTKKIERRYFLKMLLMSIPCIAVTYIALCMFLVMV